MNMNESINASNMLSARINRRAEQNVKNSLNRNDLDIANIRGGVQQIFGAKQLTGFIPNYFLFGTWSGGSNIVGP